MHFILEEPSKKETRRAKELRNAVIRSHAAAFAHNQRRWADALQQSEFYLFPDPNARVFSQQPTRELRSLAFYHGRTSIEWSGWTDRYFWTTFAPCLASSYTNISQTLSAIAAYHEFLETGRPDLSNFSVAQGRQAIAWLNQNHSTTPLVVIVAHCIITSALAALLSDYIWGQSSKIQAALIDHACDDKEGLMSLVKRDLSRQVQFFHPLHVLRTASVPDAHPDFNTFENLEQARDVLEQVLNKVAREAKCGQPLSRLLLAKWLKIFKALQHKVDHIQWLGLKAAYGMSVIQIETLYCDNETVYDQYLYVYKEVADAFEAGLTSREQPLVRFGIDAGLVRLMRWAVTWCRHPPLRRRLIQLMRDSKLVEGIEGCYIAANRGDAIRQIEESGIEPVPSCCSDIPESKRIRLQGYAHFVTAKVGRIDFLRYPYTGSVESVYITLEAGGIQLEEFESPSVSETEPDVIYGPGFRTSRLPNGSWFTLTTSDFYFTIPRF